MKRLLYASVVLVLIAAPALLQTRAAVQDPQQALLNTYCIGCHNSRAKIGGLALDSLDLQSAGAAGAIADNAEIWEKALRKLRGHLMSAGWRTHSTAVPGDPGRAVFRSSG
jgi:hypothetical protein